MKRLVKSRFAKNVAIVAAGTAGAQAITMAFSPVITRIYGPEAFGILGTFTAILAILSPLAALSYPLAIVLPKSDADAIGLAKLSLRVALATSAAVAILLLTLKHHVVSIFNLSEIEPFIFLLPAAMLCSAAMAIMSQWLIRNKSFNLLSRVAVLQALWLNSTKAGLGMFYPFAAVLVFMATLANALHALMLWLGANRSHPGWMRPEKKANNVSIKGLAWRHRDFVYYRTPQIVLNSASQSMPLLLLAGFFGPASAGFYALGKMVLAAPTTLIGQSVASVFYPRINEATHKGEDAVKLLLTATGCLAVIGVLPFGVVILFGPSLFGLVFGDEWERAGMYAQWLALWSYFGFINRPSVGAIPVFALQKLFLVYEFLSIGLRGLSLAMGYKIFGSEMGAVAIFSVVSALLNVILIAMTVIAYKAQKGASE